MTPAIYIRRLRLSKSALRLRDEKIKILDVALDAGYESVDGYQRAFKREFGCNPYQYSVSPSPIYLFKPYGVKYRNNRKDDAIMKEVKNVFIQLVEKPTRKVIIKRGKKAKDYWNYCEEVGCDVLGLLTKFRLLVANLYVCGCRNTILIPEPRSMYKVRKYLWNIPVKCRKDLM